MTETMQRWSMNALGRENLKLTQAPVPQPGPGEVRVRVNAVALNYRDKMVIEGSMPIALSFPFTPASDMAGVVESTGEGVTRFKPGARVISTFFPEWIDGRPTADARTLPHGSRWWSAVICAPDNRCWCRARAVWRYSLCKLPKRRGRRFLSRREAMKNWRGPNNSAPIMASTGLKATGLKGYTN